MDIDQLRLLVQISERGSISAAARDLNVSASLATRHLAKVEKTVGAVLFKRTTRRLELTDAGQLLVTWANRSLDSLKLVLDHVSDLETKPSGLLRFACPELLASRFLPSLIADIADRYPEIRLSLLTVDNVQDLPRDQYDAAIHIGKRPGAPFIARRVLDIEPLLCAAPKYIARYGSPKRPGDLKNHRVLAHAMYHDLNWTFDRRGRRSVHQIIAYASAMNSILLHEMALEGVGIARLTRRIAASDLRMGKLVHVMPEFRCIGTPGEPLAIWMIRPDRHMTRRTRVFIDTAVSHLRKMD